MEKIPEVIHSGTLEKMISKCQIKRIRIKVRMGNRRPIYSVEVSTSYIFPTWKCIGWEEDVHSAKACANSTFNSVLAGRNEAKKRKKQFMEAKKGYHTDTRYVAFPRLRLVAPWSGNRDKAQQINAGSSE